MHLKFNMHNVEQNGKVFNCFFSFLFFALVLFVLFVFIFFLLLFFFFFSELYLFCKSLQFNFSLVIVYSIFSFIHYLSLFLLGFACFFTVSLTSILKHFLSSFLICRRRVHTMYCTLYSSIFFKKLQIDTDHEHIT